MASASLSSVLTGMGSIGMFSSRAFVSAFAVAATLRWGPEVAWINDLGLVQRVTDAPTWFTHDITLIVLGILAALEVIATKSAEARELLNEVDGYLKAGSAFVSTLTVAGVLSAEDAALLKQVAAAFEPVHAGLGDSAVGYLSGGLAAGGVWFASVARGRLLALFIEADPDDDTMIVGLLSWAEDLWALLGTLLLFLFPFVMLGITATLLIFLWLLQLQARRKEEQSKTPCTRCGETMYRCAVQCPHCATPNPAIHALNWLGQSTTEPADNPALQPVLLTQKQRCPSCATYLKPRKTRQTCPACAYELFKNPEDEKRYIATLDGRLAIVLLGSGLLSLIPIVGLIPGVMLYRIKLVAPLRRYTAMTRTIPVRWGLRVIFFILVWFQLTPGFGALAVPLMALMSYGAYRAMFQKQLERERLKDKA
ncbi:MAG: hypothetical protein ACIAXF_14125 [Phycisphaerales bacterium JB063]